jgi:hypothetical protein
MIPRTLGGGVAGADAPLGTNTHYFSDKTCYASSAFIVHAGKDIFLIRGANENALFDRN